MYILASCTVTTSPDNPRCHFGTIPEISTSPYSVAALVKALNAVESFIQRKELSTRIIEARFNIFTLEQLLLSLKTYKRGTIDGWLKKHLEKEGKPWISASIAESYSDSITIWGPNLDHTSFRIEDNSSRFGRDQDPRSLYFNRESITLYLNKDQDKTDAIARRLEQVKENLSEYEKTLFHIQSVNLLVKKYTDTVEQAKKDYLTKAKALTGESEYPMFKPF